MIQEDKNIECPLCKYELYGHSFDVINVTEFTTYFYTCPIYGKDYKNIDHIISHIDAEIGKLEDYEQWSLIVDCSGLQMKHVYNYNVAQEIVKHINIYYLYNLSEVIIINRNWKFNLLYKWLKNYISKELLSKVKYDLNNEFDKLITFYISNRT